MPCRASIRREPAPQDDQQSVLRTYGIGAQILKDLGVRRMRVLSAPKQFQGISAFDLEVAEYVGHDRHLSHAELRSSMAPCACSHARAGGISRAGPACGPGRRALQRRHRRLDGRRCAGGLASGRAATRGRCCWCARPAPSSCRWRRASSLRVAASTPSWRWAA